MAHRMTLDRLAAMTARGFEDLRREMHDGFTAIRAVLDGHNDVLKDHSVRLDRIERKLDSTIERDATLAEPFTHRCYNE